MDLNECRVVNLRKEKYDVYIGRSRYAPKDGVGDGYFGNPFTVKDHSEKALRMY